MRIIQPYEDLIETINKIVITTVIAITIIVIGIIIAIIVC